MPERQPNFDELTTLANAQPFARPTPAEIQIQRYADLMGPAIGKPLFDILATVKSQRDQLCYEFTQKHRISFLLGESIHRAITEGDGIADAIDILIDEMDTDDWEAIVGRVRTALNLPEPVSENFGLISQVEVYDSAAEMLDALSGRAPGRVAPRWPAPGSLPPSLEAAFDKFLSACGGGTSNADFSGDEVMVLDQVHGGRDEEREELLETLRLKVASLNGVDPSDIHLLSAEGSNEALKRLLADLS